MREQCTGSETPALGPPWTHGRSALGPWVACVWLVFLVPSFVDGWHDRTHVRGLIAMAATVAFIALYGVVFAGTRRDRRRLVTLPRLRWAGPYVAALAALALLLIWTTRSDGLVAAIFVAAAGMMTLPLRFAIPTVVAAFAGTLAVTIEHNWAGGGGVAFGVVLASLATFGMRTVMARNLELWRAHEQNTLLAVDNERNRFARDLHDILGHSLTVITVKAELAQRLLEADPARARAEIADLERLSRDALADVRRAVEGYRELTLPGELARARAALQAAEIEPDLPQSTDVVPTELRELFAWTVREGVTNVIRHSGASRCEIRLTDTRAAVRDDGAGAGGAAEGSGLIGLRERAAAVGARVSTRALVPGFLLEVTL